MTDFFIADLHLGHKNICKYQPVERPFSTLDEMHKAIITNWNSVVGKRDRVFVLGDFCFGKNYLPIAQRLNGMKYLIQGNHDTLSTTRYLQYFHKVCGCLEYKGYILTHIPVHPGQFDRYLGNIHGHLHSHKIDDERYINVSCEQIKLTPVTFDQLNLKGRGKSE